MANVVHQFKSTLLAIGKSDIKILTINEHYGSNNSITVFNPVESNAEFDTFTSIYSSQEPDMKCSLQVYQRTDGKYFLNGFSSTGSKIFEVALAPDQTNLDDLFATGTKSADVITMSNTDRPFLKFKNLDTEAEFILSRGQNGSYPYYYGVVGTTQININRLDNNWLYTETPIPTYRDIVVKLSNAEWTTPVGWNYPDGRSHNVVYCKYGNNRVYSCRVEMTNFGPSNPPILLCDTAFELDFSPTTGQPLLADEAINVSINYDLYITGQGYTDQATAMSAAPKLAHIQGFYIDGKGVPPHWFYCPKAYDSTLDAFVNLNTVYFSPEFTDETPAGYGWTFTIKAEFQVNIVDHIFSIIQKGSDK